MNNFGQKDAPPDPPTCPIDIFAIPDPNTSHYVSYSIPVRGVVCEIKSIVINKVMEVSTGSGTCMCY